MRRLVRAAAVMGLVAAVGLLGSAGVGSGGPVAVHAAGSAPPALISPANGVRLPEMTVTLDWDNPPGATWHQIQLVPFNNDGVGVDLLVGDTVEVARGLLTIPAPDLGTAAGNYILLPDMTYTWRVRSATVGAPSDGDWSEWVSRSFRTPTRSGASIGPASPTQDGVVTNVRPTLTWFNVDRTVFYYEVQVSKDPDFGPTGFLYNELIHGGLSKPPNSYTVPDRYPLEANVQYYWRVRPRVQGDGTPPPWSSTFRFSANLDALRR